MDNTADNRSAAEQEDHLIMLFYYAVVTVRKSDLQLNVNDKGEGKVRQ